MHEGLIAVAVLALVVLGGNLLVRWGRRGAGPARLPRTGGPLVIRPPRRNAIMFGITALIPAALLGTLTLFWRRLGHVGTVGLFTGMVVTLLVAGFAGYQFAYALRARLVVHDTGIERVGVLRRSLVGWGTIAKVAFNPHHHWFFVTLSDRSHLWLPADVAGMPEFAQIARRRLPPAALEGDPLAREVLEDLAALVADETRPDAR